MTPCEPAWNGVCRRVWKEPRAGWGTGLALWIQAECGWKLSHYRAITKPGAGKGTVKTCQGWENQQDGENEATRGVEKCTQEKLQREEPIKLIQTVVHRPLNLHNWESHLAVDCWGTSWAATSWGEGYFHQGLSASSKDNGRHHHEYQPPV